jgi:uncharacterized repeat protein (TIGR03803 family)
MNSSLQLRIGVTSFFVLVILASTLGMAQTETVLYNFPLAKDGLAAGNPYAAPILDASGNIYGTTISGGANNAGSVFMLSPDSNGQWTEIDLHSFSGDGQDGVQPYSSLVMDSAGNLYGTTYAGGAYNLGTVFELHPNAGGNWTETILHSFNADGTDGYNPYANLTFDKLGNFYGTTYSGGNQGNGTVFELLPQEDGTWQEQIILNFNYTDGAAPYGGVVFDAAGRLYGTTRYGGDFQQGVVFTMQRKSKNVWIETVLFSFQAGFDGWAPYAGLAIDKSGHLYGTTLYGGTQGSGTVFEMAKVQGAWQETVIHNFTAYGEDGINPYGPVAIDATGNLYGTTWQSLMDNVGGAGIVFELSKTKPNVWQETILHNFVNPDDGGNPYSGVAVDSAGHVFGTTYAGGVSAGTVFEIIPKVVTTTAVTSSPNPSTYGQSVTFTAMVTSKSGAPTDGASITFMQGSTVLGSGVLGKGMASFSTSTLGVGTKRVTVIYAGDSNFLASTSKPISQVIVKAASTTTLISSQNPSMAAQSVTFTAKVTPQISGTIRGTVTFSDGATVLKTVSVSGGAAKFTTSTLTSGKHTIQATYNGSPDFIGSSVSLAQTVK